MINLDDFQNVEVDGQLTIDKKTHTYKAYRLVHKITGKEFGTYFQEKCRTPAWKSAYVIIEKYKRKYNLDYTDLVELRNYLENFINNRLSQGKKCSNDFITQEASVYIKKIGESRLKENENFIESY